MRENKIQNLKIISLSVCLLFLYSMGVFRAFAERQFTYDAKGKRNPFIPLVTPDGRLLKLDDEAAATGVSLSLQGIIFDKYGSSYALVNGEPVRVGDMVGDYQVLKIEKSKVIFIKDGQPQELEFKTEEGQ